MFIRKFNKGDEEKLFDVFFSAVHDVASKDYTQKQINAWAPTDINIKLWAENIKKLQPFIVVINDQVAGYSDLQSNGYIDHFYIGSRYGRQGIGTYLMKHIIDEARLCSIHSLTAYVSKTAEPFFLLHGFHVVERNFPIRRGVMLENAFMKKNL